MSLQQSHGAFHYQCIKSCLPAQPVFSSGCSSFLMLKVTCAPERVFVFPLWFVKFVTVWIFCSSAVVQLGGGRKQVLYMTSLQPHTLIVGHNYGFIVIEVLFLNKCNISKHTSLRLKVISKLDQNVSQNSGYMSRTCRNKNKDSALGAKPWMMEWWKTTGEKQHLQHVLPTDLVQITVGQSSDVSAGLSRKNVQINGLSKDIVLSWGRRIRIKDTSGNVDLAPEGSCPPKIATTTRPFRISIEPLEMK